MRAAAASVVGRLKVEALAPRLEACLARPDTALQVSAATALAQLGSEGVAALERVVTQDDAAGRRVAREIAEKARTGRLQMATI